MTDWSAVIPPPAVATALMRIAQTAPEKRVVAPADSGNVGNDEKNRHPPPDTPMRRSVVVPARPDTDRPTGPPPTFEANVLEADAERRRQKISETETGPSRDAPVTDAEGGDGSDHVPGVADGTPPTGGAERTGIASYYSDLPAMAEPQLDLIR